MARPRTWKTYEREMKDVERIPGRVNRKAKRAMEEISDRVSEML